VSLWITEAEVVRLLDMKGAIARIGRAAGAGSRRQSREHGVEEDARLWAEIIRARDSAPRLRRGLSRHWHQDLGADTVCGAVLICRQPQRVAQTIIEAFAIGRQLTHRWDQRLGDKNTWRPEGASDMALIGTGKQALTQLAAVAAVRQRRLVRTFSSDGTQKGRSSSGGPEGAGLNVVLRHPRSPRGRRAVSSRWCFIFSADQAPFFFLFLGSAGRAGVHVNAVGAISPERTEFRGRPLLSRCAGGGGAESVPKVQNICERFSKITVGTIEMARKAKCVRYLTWARRQRRPAGADLHIVKAYGHGPFSDLASSIKLRAGRARAAPRPRNSATRHPPKTVRLKEAP